MRLPQTDEEIDQVAVVIAAALGGVTAFVLSGSLAAQLPETWRIRRGAWAAMGIAMTMLGASRMDEVKRRHAARRDGANPDD